MVSNRRVSAHYMKEGMRLIFRKVRRQVPLSIRRRYLHAIRHRRLLHLHNPKTFNEKLSWRMVYDRREILKGTCDKIAMKQLAVDRAGQLLRVPRVIWSGRDVREIAHVALPEYWVLKPNHRSGLVYIGHGTPVLDSVIDSTSGWLDEINASEHGEWAYSHAEPKLLIEEFIGVPGQIPVDYKFEVFDGVVRAVWVYVGRFGEFRGCLFDRNFMRLDVSGYSAPLHKYEMLVPPPNYGRMVEAAERIAEGFDYMRVDLYDTANDVWFGEITPYSANGGEVFNPTSFDRDLGSYWKLPRAEVMRSRREASS